MPPYPIELRSDTQTTPTEEMRAAMAQAVVGDDLGGEDPTVRDPGRPRRRDLQQGFSLVRDSGTMGNLVSLLTLSLSAATHCWLIRSRT